MCRPDDFPPYDPALGLHEPPRNSEGPLPPLTAVSPEELQRHRAAFDDYIANYHRATTVTPAEAEAMAAEIGLVLADVRCVYCGNTFYGEADDIACVVSSYTGPAGWIAWTARGGRS